MSNQRSVTESNLKLVEQFNETVFVDHDFDRLEEFVSADVTQVEDGDVAFEGSEALRAYFEGMLETYENPEMEVLSMVGDDDVVMYNFRMNATARDDLEVGAETIEAAGKQLSWSGFVSLTIVDGRIVEANLLTDEAGLLRQLGVLPQRAT